MSAGGKVRLRSGKDRPIRFGHPWVFSGAIGSASGELAPGDIVAVEAADGELLGSGYVHPSTTIAVRMLCHGARAVDRTLIHEKVAAAFELRERFLGAQTTAYRLVNGEGDGLPGFIVDRYGDFLVLQVLTAGAERMRDWLLDALRELVKPTAIYERSEGSVRRAEGLENRVEMAHGDIPAGMTILENGARFHVDPVGGQKTGFFLDQRDNRALLREIARGARVLDTFCYTGGFAVSAGIGGARSVTAIDASSRALVLAAENWRANGLADDMVNFVEADVPRFLRETSDDYDVVVLDPPALAKQRKDLERGSRAYKDIHLSVFRHSRPGSLLLTFSCSQHVDAELFRKIVIGAAADARREVQLVRTLGPGLDHPVALGHPEGEYLNGLFLRVL